MIQRHNYTADQLQFLKVEYARLPLVQLAEKFNQRFKTDLTPKRIKSTLERRGITSGRCPQFRQGNVPWNTGKKGSQGANATSWKRGNLPHNHRPLWSERINRDGCIEISVPEPNPYTGFPTRFKLKHIWLWEQQNGPVPEGMVIVFRDGNNRNFDPANLLAVTRQELIAMNMHGYKSQPEELKPTILALSRLEAKAGIRCKI